MSVAEAQPIDLEHSKPVNMPITKANAVLIESSSASSCEQSLLDTYHRTFEEVGGVGELQLKEDLADAMLESPGIRETGGRCVIVQMKPAVAKVVNPLGTVVNLQSDDEMDVEIYEDIVIHENCDEALFRPMVVPKVLPLHERTKRYGDNIITKSLESTTEVKILKKKSNSESQTNQFYELMNDKSKYKEKEINKVENCKNIIEQNSEPKSTKPKGKCAAKAQIDISDPFDDIPSFKPVTEIKSLKEAIKIPVLEPLKEIDTTPLDINKDFNFELQPLDKDDFFSLENLSKVDEFEDVGESLMLPSYKGKGKSKTNKAKSSVFDDSSITTLEDTMEEKSISKRTRKPKAKLGVKIAGTNKENSKTEKVIDDCLAEITLPTPIKKSWSSIAASKPVAEKLLIDSTDTDKENGLNLDLPKIEFVEEFTLQLPKKSNAPAVVTDLIDINTPQEEKAQREERNEDIEEVVCENVDLLKIDKSSDDEKGDTSSSPAEVTESDDSGKNAANETVFEELLDSNIVVPSSKSSRRKKRRK